MKKLLLFILLSFPSALVAQNVGVGTDNPQEFFSVGASSQFRVNANGNVVRINNVQYSFPAVQATSGSILANDGSGNLTWTKVTTGNISATGTASNTTFLRGDGAWTAPAGGGGAAIVATTTLNQTVVGLIPFGVGNVGTQVFSHAIVTSGTYMVTGYAASSGGGAIDRISFIVKKNGNIIHIDGNTFQFDDLALGNLSAVFYGEASDVITIFVAFYASTNSINGNIFLTKL